MLGIWLGDRLSESRHRAALNNRGSAFLSYGSEGKVLVFFFFFL